MKEETYSYLHEHCPKLMEDCRLRRSDPNLWHSRHPNATEYHCFDQFGFETPNGWDEPIKRLMVRLHELLTPYYGTPEEVLISQIKSKFGSLSVYFTAAKPADVADQVNEAVKAATTECDATSEKSGLPGAKGHVIGGWIYKLTDEEAKLATEVNNRAIEIDAVERAAVMKLAKAQTPEARIQKALEILVRYGQIDGGHHKAWVIDQAVRALAGDEYQAIIACENEHWDEGVAP